MKSLFYIIDIVFLLFNLQINAQQKQQSKPNILIIMTDQQTASAMSNAGNKYLNTPAMDRLAANGIKFTRAYCAQPLCTPSRVAIFSGKMPFETGFIGNAPEKDGLWKDSIQVMGKIFKDANYKTGYIGKWHLPIPTTKVSQHGFDFIQNTNFLDYNDASTPSYVARFIKESKNTPFLLVTSFLNPHDICEWARGESLKMDILENTPPPDLCPPLPHNWDISINEPKIIREQQKVSFRTYPTTNWTSNQWRQYRWAYNRLVEKVDYYIGMVLASLEKYNVAENTIIIFTADHGDGYAAHRWNQKQVLYEEVANVPFIISKLNEWKPKVDETLVCNGTDILTTIAGFAEIKVPSNLKGIDLSKKVKNVDIKLRDTLVIETDFADNDKLMDISGRAIITKDYKYIVYNKGKIREQLFNLTKDPGETNNLATDDNFHQLLKVMRTYLKQWGKTHNDSFQSGIY